MLVGQRFGQNCNFGDPDVVVFLIENMRVCCQIQSSVEPLTKEREISQVNQGFDGQKNSKSSCAFQQTSLE